MDFTKALKLRALETTNRLLSTKNLGVGPVVEPDLASDERFMPHYEACRPFTMVSPERAYAVAEAVRHVVETAVPGDFVECGVWKGGCALLMARVAETLGVGDRRIWLYDTFAGMSQPSNADGEHARSKWEAMQRNGHNEWCYSSLDEVKATISARTKYPASLFEFVAGRVEDTIPARIPDAISVLRLDTDWYESTRHELEHLWPLVSPGGVLLIDDYGRWSGARQAVDEFFKGSGLLMHRTDRTGRVIQKPGTEGAAG